MRRFILVALALVVTEVACDNGSSSSIPSATSPTVTLTTETFTGTVEAGIGNSDFHNFTVAQSGAVTVTLSAAGPPPTITMGLGVGTPSSSTCALLSGAFTPAQASTTAQLSGTLSAGSYCVQVSDVGNQTTPVTYTVTVVHP